MAHAAPLLETLHLQPLEVRRRLHISELVQSMISRSCHPAFLDFFTINGDGDVVINYTPRIRMGAKRFAVMGATVFNEIRHTPG